MTIRILIADDNSFIREGMKIILSSYDEFTVVEMVENGREAVDCCIKGQVDIALLDVRMPVMNGVEATKLIREKTEVLPIILTTFDDDEYILGAIRNGAKGYLLKNTHPERIREAINSVVNGTSIIQDSVLEKIRESLVMDERPRLKFNPEPFTERELNIMESIAKGFSNKEISERLFISGGTVANHITSILNKTALKHRTQIAIYYLTGNV
ncbi:response regulator transcription factor [Aciduricibacillus chroicocephali]|uniref:Response regulator transcription factor n=1 Tax=Aciduricibacillus chroicocephali TaxID=3054939 RepID=A0ABY9KVE9_9BACI|nr:response regulator transcription factor [Bacillaceae bacterium 44XB]